MNDTLSLTKDLTLRPLLFRVIMLSAGIFFFFLIAGYVCTIMDPSFGADMLALFEEMVAAQIRTDSAPLLAFQIFLNNLEICVILFLGGAAFGMLTLLILAINGITIGAILEVLRQEEGNAMVLAAIIPHGIFELPAVITSAALGFMLGRAIINEWQQGGDAARAAYPLGRLFVLYVVPFITVAACIEAFITPAVIQMLAL